MTKPIVVAAATAEAAMRLAQRSDRPVDLGPASNPERAAQGWRRWSFAPLAPVSIPASPPREGLIDKVRKLLALAANHAATEAEAANAAAAAQRLIEQHRLDSALLDTEAEGDAVELPVEEVGASTLFDSEGRQKVANWRMYLAGGVARPNGCRVYSSRGDIRIVGSPSRVAVARALYMYLSHEIDRLAHVEAMGRGRGYAASWRAGCAVRLSERLEEASRKGAEEAKRMAISRGVALVRVETALAQTMNERIRVDAWVKNNVKLHSRGRPSVDGDAYSRGKLAGNRVNISGPRSLGSGNRLGS